MSLTKTVPCGVPSLFQSSGPCSSSQATKKSVPFTLVSDAGLEPLAPTLTSLRRYVASTSVFVGGLPPQEIAEQIPIPAPRVTPNLFCRLAWITSSNCKCPFRTSQATRYHE